MKKNNILIFFAFLLFTITCKAGNSGNTEVKVIQMTDEDFKQKVFNYETDSQWNYKGKVPAIIDFYADWCMPCRRMSPILDEIAAEFAGKIIVYRVNTDMEKKLSQAIGISSLPTLLFIPATGRPQASVGLIPKEDLLKAINDVLQIK
jgi:thioredoxin 1